MLNTINPQNLQFTTEQWIALAPYLMLTVGAFLTMLLTTLESAKKSKLFLFGTTVLILSAAAICTTLHWVKEPMVLFAGMLTLDYFSSFFTVLLCSATILVLFGSYTYLEDGKIHYGEFYPMILVSTLGMMLLSAASELLTIFIALEVMSLTVYVLVGIRRRNALSNEASIKYFVMGGVSAAIFLYGTALIYGATNSTKLSQISTILSQVGNPLMVNPIFVVGFIMIVVGFLFKIASAPFHMWAPDVYEGAPANITAYMSTALKAAVFATLIRLAVSFIGDHGVLLTAGLTKPIHTGLWVLALITMVAGNFAALMQNNLKRLMAYSAIAHTGYLMIGLLSGSQVGYAGIIFYLVAYICMNIGAFTLFSLLAGDSDDRLTLQGITGLAKRHPGVAAALTVFLLSLGGFPPTAGFVAKYFLFTGALEAGETLLVLIAVITSAVSVFYYLRIVVLMYMKDSPSEFAQFKPSMLAYIAITACVILTIGYGMFPGQLIEAVKKAAIF